uniref:DNA-directed RNA polymerase n=1 Tax=Colemanosphaera angeleri TaxID=1454018 RepID=A0A6C0RWU1_9CHLO|nr:beta' subunit of RNA polymerase [Colemanosphaera angeleri]QIA47173.1 beta' subunit of RNA polymerase [Colemanosphaera angeleri]
MNIVLPQKINKFVKKNTKTKQKCQNIALFQCESFYSHKTLRKKLNQTSCACDNIIEPKKIILMVNGQNTKISGHLCYAVWQTNTGLLGKINYSNYISSKKVYGLSNTTVIKPFNISSNTVNKYYKKSNTKTILCSNVTNHTATFFNITFDKGRLKNLVSWTLENYGQYKTVELLEQLKKTGFQYATKAGISLGIDDLKIPPKKRTLLLEAEQLTKLTVHQYQRADITTVERFQRLIDTWHRTSEQLKQEVITYFEETDILNPVYMMAFSGARGNISQVRQLVGMRGLMSDPQGQIIDFPIRSNFREGLTLTEYIISSYGARKGIVDTALRTANAGYLTRRLVDVAQHVIISHYDCGTQKGIFLTDMKEGNKTMVTAQSRMIGRVLARDIYKPNTKIKVFSRNQEISTDVAFEISKITNKIFVRSALTCNTTKLLCQLCYGWSLAQGNLVSVGEAVGVIAAQSIGEPGTQLTMRTFHTGGVFSGDVSDEIRAPYNGFVFYENTIPGILIRALDGKILFLTKSDGTLIFSKQSSLTEQIAVSSEIKKYKIPAYTILFIRNGESVLQKQVIAQITSIKAKSTVRDTAEFVIKSELEGLFYGKHLRILKKIIGPKPKLVGQAKQNILLDPKAMEIVVKARGWNFAWVLSGKRYELPLLLKTFPNIGDFITPQTVIARHNIKLPSYFSLKLNITSKKSSTQHPSMRDMNTTLAGSDYFAYSKTSEVYHIGFENTKTLHNWSPMPFFDKKQPNVLAMPNKVKRVRKILLSNFFKKYTLKLTKKEKSHLQSSYYAISNKKGYVKEQRKVILSKLPVLKATFANSVWQNQSKPKLAISEQNFSTTEFSISPKSLQLIMNAKLCWQRYFMENKNNIGYLFMENIKMKQDFLSLNLKKIKYHKIGYFHFFNSQQLKMNSCSHGLEVQKTFSLGQPQPMYYPTANTYSVNPANTLFLQQAKVLLHSFVCQSQLQEKLNKTCDKTVIDFEAFRVNSEYPVSPMAMKKTIKFNYNINYNQVMLSPTSLKSDKPLKKTIVLKRFNPSNYLLEWFSPYKQTSLQCNISESFYTPLALSHKFSNIKSKYKLGLQNNIGFVIAGSSHFLFSKASFVKLLENIPKQKTKLLTIKKHQKMMSSSFKFNIKQTIESIFKDEAETTSQFFELLKAENALKKYRKIYTSKKTLLSELTRTQNRHNYESTVSKPNITWQSQPTFYYTQQMNLQNLIFKKWFKEKKSIHFSNTKKNKIAQNRIKYSIGTYFNCNDYLNYLTKKIAVFVTNSSVPTKYLVQPITYKKPIQKDHAFRVNSENLQHIVKDHTTNQKPKYSIFEYFKLSQNQQGKKQILKHIKDNIIHRKNLKFLSSFVLKEIPLVSFITKAFQNSNNCHETRSAKIILVRFTHKLIHCNYQQKNHSKKLSFLRTLFVEPNYKVKGKYSSKIDFLNNTNRVLYFADFQNSRLIKKQGKGQKSATANSNCIMLQHNKLNNSQNKKLSLFNKKFKLTTNHIDYMYNYYMFNSRKINMFRVNSDSKTILNTLYVSYNYLLSNFTNKTIKQKIRKNQTKRILPEGLPHTVLSFCFSKKEFIRIPSKLGQQLNSELCYREKQAKPAKRTKRKQNLTHNTKQKVYILINIKNKYLKTLPTKTIVDSTHLNKASKSQVSYNTFYDLKDAIVVQGNLLKEFDDTVWVYKVMVSPYCKNQQKIVNVNFQQYLTYMSNNQQNFTESQQIERILKTEIFKKDLIWIKNKKPRFLPKHLETSFLEQEQKMKSLEPKKSNNTGSPNGENATSDGSISSTPKMLLHNKPVDRFRVNSENLWLLEKGKSKVSNGEYNSNIMHSNTKINNFANKETFFHQNLSLENIRQILPNEYAFSAKDAKTAFALPMQDVSLNTKTISRKTFSYLINYLNKKDKLTLDNLKTLKKQYEIIKKQNPNLSEFTRNTNSSFGILFKNKTKITNNKNSKNEDLSNSQSNSFLTSKYLLLSLNSELTRKSLLSELTRNAKKSELTRNTKKSELTRNSLQNHKLAYLSAKKQTENSKTSISHNNATNPTKQTLKNFYKDIRSRKQTSLCKGSTNILYNNGHTLFLKVAKNIKKLEITQAFFNKNKLKKLNKMEIRAFGEIKKCLVYLILNKKIKPLINTLPKQKKDLSLLPKNPNFSLIFHTYNKKNVAFNTMNLLYNHIITSNSIEQALAKTKQFSSKPWCSLEYLIDNYLKVKGEEDKNILNARKIIGKYNIIAKNFFGIRKNFKKMISYIQPSFFNLYFKNPSYIFTYTQKMLFNDNKIKIIPKQPCLNVCFYSKHTFKQENSHLIAQTPKTIAQQNINMKKYFLIGNHTKSNRKLLIAKKQQLLQSNKNWFLNRINVGAQLVNRIDFDYHNTDLVAQRNHFSPFEGELLETKPYKNYLDLNPYENLKTGLIQFNNVSNHKTKEEKMRMAMFKYYVNTKTKEKKVEPVSTKPIQFSGGEQKSWSRFNCILTKKDLITLTYNQLDIVNKLQPCVKTILHLNKENLFNKASNFNLKKEWLKQIIVGQLNKSKSQTPMSNQLTSYILQKHSNLTFLDVLSNLSTKAIKVKVKMALPRKNHLDVAKPTIKRDFIAKICSHSFLCIFYNSNLNIKWIKLKQKQVFAKNKVGFFILKGNAFFNTHTKITTNNFLNSAKAKFAFGEDTFLVDTRSLNFSYCLEFQKLHLNTNFLKLKPLSDKFIFILQDLKLQSSYSYHCYNNTSIKQHFFYKKHQYYTKYQSEHQSFSNSSWKNKIASSLHLEHKDLFYFIKPTYTTTFSNFNKEFFICNYRKHAFLVLKKSNLFPIKEGILLKQKRINSEYIINQQPNLVIEQKSGSFAFGTRSKKILGDIKNNIQKPICNSNNLPLEGFANSIDKINSNYKNTIKRLQIFYINLIKTYIHAKTELRNNSLYSELTRNRMEFVQSSLKNENKTPFLKPALLKNENSLLFFSLDTFRTIEVIKKSGQLIHMNQQKITIRIGQPLVISPRSIIHASHGDFVRYKTPVITLTYQQLKTGDIVQGIPKIEQLFEARTTKRGRLFRDNVTNLLTGLFLNYFVKSTYLLRKNMLNISKKTNQTISLDLFVNNKQNQTLILALALQWSVKQSFYKIQQIIVDGILRVYRSQGVSIADKHVEIIVKQMTSKVRIINSNKAKLTDYSFSLQNIKRGLSLFNQQTKTNKAFENKLLEQLLSDNLEGPTGLFPGEIVDIEFVENINIHLANNLSSLLNNINVTNILNTNNQTTFAIEPIKYEPIVLGITRASLEVESFLSAASFQQTTRVLSQAALFKKKDFLKGLKENIIIGNLIPAGTGYISSLNI